MKEQLTTTASTKLPALPQRLELKGYAKGYPSVKEGCSDTPGCLWSSHTDTAPSVTGHVDPYVPAPTVS